MTTQRSLLDRLVAEELTLQHCRDIRAEIDAQAKVGLVLRREFNFNCYEVAIDFQSSTVSVVDVLDAGESGTQQVPFSEFVGVLDSFARARSGVSSDELGQLFQFFAAYFNEDWDLDAPNDEGIIDRFIVETPSAVERREFAALVERFATHHHDDRLLAEAVFKVLGCYYLPREDVGMREWLKRLAARLRAETQR
jgi:hypothetical protein